MNFVLALCTNIPSVFCKKKIKKKSHTFLNTPAETTRKKLPAHQLDMLEALLTGHRQDRADFRICNQTQIILLTETIANCGYKLVTMQRMDANMHEGSFLTVTLT